MPIPEETFKVFIPEKPERGAHLLWRAVVRIKGYPTVCDLFDRKPEAEDWVRDTRNRIKLGQYKFDQHKKIHTFTQTT